MCAIPVILFILIRYFGLKIQFNKMNSTVTKLLAVSNLLPLARTQRTEFIVQAQTHEVFTSAFQISLALIAMYMGYRFVKFLYNYITMVNLTAVQTRETLFNFLVCEKTDIYLQLTSNYGATTITLYIGTLFGNPENITISGKLPLSGALYLDKHFPYDFVHVHWSGLHICMRDIALSLPSDIPVYLIKALLVRRVFKSNQGLYKLIAYNPSSLKVRSLTDFAKIHMSVTDIEVAMNDNANYEIVHIKTTNDTEVIEIGCPKEDNATDRDSNCTNIGLSAMEMLYTDMT